MEQDTPQIAEFETVTYAGSSADWIVMVHGVSQDRRIFSKQVEEFKESYRLILIDMPGHGLSAELPGPYGLEEYASCIAATLQSAGVQYPHYWGTHLGAGAGLLLQCRQPDTFKSLILEGPVFPGRPLPSVNNILRSVAAIAHQYGMAAAREKWWKEGEWFSVMRKHPIKCRALEQRTIINDFGGKPWLDSGLASREIAPIGEQLAKLETPTLIINGEYDLSEFKDVAVVLETLLANSQHCIIEGGGGFPLWEFPGQVNREVRSFLEDI